jgi:hypothetical protein
MEAANSQPNGGDIMSTDFRAVEDAAPVDASGPMPLTVTTLEFIPEERRQQYVRRMDGTFQLAWINADDSNSHTAYLDMVAAGKLQVVPEGMTPAELEQRERERKEGEAEALRYLNEMQAAADAKREAELRAKEDAKLAEIRAEQERRNRSYR